MSVDRSYVVKNNAERARLRALVERASDADLARPMPAGWTVASVPAHVAFWDQRIITLLDAWQRAGIDNFDQLFTRELTVGGTGSGADTNQFPKVMNGVLGTKMKVVSGYPGGNDVVLAMERGEVDGRCGWSWANLSWRGCSCCSSQFWGA